MIPKNESKAFAIVVSVIALLLFVGVVGYMFVLPVLAGKDTMAFSVTTFYEEGDSQTDVQPVFTLYPETVVDSTTGRGIIRYEYTLSMSPTYTGTATTTKVSGNVVYSVNGASKRTDPISVTQLVQNGQTIVVATGTIDAATLEGWSNTPGSKSLSFAANLSFEATFQGSSTPVTKTGTASATINYIVQSSGAITGLNVVFTNRSTLQPG